MSFPYKQVLVVGATSGIGKALAEKFVSGGSKVIVVGRRKEALDAFVKEHGEGKATAAQFDITELAKIPEFVKSLFETHRDIDAVLLNSGIQRGADLADPASLDLKTLDAEMTTNYTAYVHLITAIQPYLQTQKGKQTAIMAVTSGLALIPIVRCANYCASKAALHHYLLVLRKALERSSVKVIEILPPAVQTELHDEKNQPDFDGPRDIGLPLADFINETWDRLQKGEEQIPVGFAENAFEGFELKRQEMFEALTVGKLKPTAKN